MIFKKWIYSITSFTNLTCVHCMYFAIFQTGDVSAHRDDEQEIVTGRQSFMKLFFLLLWQLYGFKFTRVLWNYIYLNWNKAFFHYFKIFNFFPSEIGNIALKVEIGQPIKFSTAFSWCIVLWYYRCIMIWLKISGTFQCAMYMHIWNFLVRALWWNR
jgi:hypothetical protein